ncbi:uncharacterized protein B0H64DRAFT_206199 [Chaetomium fimeti]|uniref:Nitrate reductase [NADPH] n=1 Tax=Chaetomium fimeti TaxID=1854472 RepID=A0AAE0LQF9_9PEZI|nr:hypothetical protein B0H64DRAFT_206199 [Chaetomium fimeti]
MVDATTYSKMAQHIPWEVTVTDHPGSSEQDIKDEPDWVKLHAHAIGFVNHEGRRPGLTHFRHEKEVEISQRMREDLTQRVSAGDLVNFRDLIESQEDFHLRYPDNRSLGWRYVLEATEDWVKNQQDWPANVEKRKKQEEAKKKKEEEKKEEKTKADEKGKPQEDQEKSKGRQKQPDLTPQERSFLAAVEREARTMASLKVNDGKQKSPQTHNRSSITIDEQDQFTPDNWLPRCPDLIRLTGKHPMNAEPSITRLFEGGLITPNELHFIRNHGAVPRLLWEFHRLDVTHNNKTLSLSMDELKTRYASSVINIPIVMACTGNRRKELNLLRKTKGANNTAASVGCAYWKGPTLRAVLLSAGVPDHTTTTPTDSSTESTESTQRTWVHFAGADSPSGGTYETCIPLAHAMDVGRDVLLATHMNDLPLPPDHGYPVRLMVPGHVGGRCVKWLRRIWTSARENESHYHVWDNRVVPPAVRGKEGPLAEALFRHPSTVCNEMALSSMVCRPAQGERVVLSEVGRGAVYRVKGFAFAGAGLEVQQVEVSLDGGSNWLFAERQFPEYPIRHGNRFWAWVFWEVEVELADLVRAPSVIVRCSDAGKNSQPRDFTWNVMGMMNNSWYTVKTETVLDEDDGSPAVLFRHPTEAAAGEGGWMQPSEELKTAQAKQNAATPQKQFTREEIEKHGKEGDCWIVVDNKVYDATSVLAWHPGGAAAIMSHAGKCHHDTTEEFSSIHDDYGYKKMQECILGVVTEKTANFIKQTAEKAAKERAENAQRQGEKGTQLALQKHRWVPVKLVDRREISEDTRTYTFELPPGKPELGLGTCQHIHVGFHLKDKMLVRPYTPTRPVMPSPPASPAREAAAASNSPNKEKGKENQEEKKPPTPPESPTTPFHTPSQTQQPPQAQPQSSCTPPPHNNTNSTNNTNNNTTATFDLTIKTYFPTPSQPGGALSNLLDCMPLGEELEIRGPTGDIVYLGDSEFLITGAFAPQPRRLRFPRVSLVLGGSGITPGYALMAAILQGGGGGAKGEGKGGEGGEEGGDRTEVRAVDANQTEGDILLKEELDWFERESGGRVQVVHVLSEPGEEWEGERGLVDADLLKKVLFPPGEGSAVFLCGPPGLVRKAAMPALKEWGYVEDENMFGF